MKNNNSIWDKYPLLFGIPFMLLVYFFMLVEYLAIPLIVGLCVYTLTRLN